MSLDKSLKSGNQLQRHRNVLTRPERIAKLQELGEWEDDRSAFGLPKVIHRKASVGKKSKAEKTDDQAVEGEAAPAEETTSK